ncbi:hypothetical protein [Mongoliitalea lutea]|uniref:Uncharacterized protein n=1 Tax=Mongoliitalea lutea TaxID=849756 RepID=A0A8J3D129_9BACT|nr:hypothetical protein [Mongoliitalea lutea]GHB44397.1 hypothetical protein GCM10008106_26830 [Mongoliitalea lutea]
MNTLEIPEKDIKLEIPSHWDEMSEEQRNYCLKQAIWASFGIISVDEARVRCLYFLLEIKRDWASIAKDRILGQDRVLDKYSRIYVLCDELITFLFKSNDSGLLEINYDTVYNYYPVFQTKKATLHGPDHLLADISFGEFRAAIEYMNEYFESKEELTLCKMIACLYRPERDNFQQVSKHENFDGLRRQPFNRNKVHENALLVKNISSIHKTVILLWFTYCIQYIQSEDLTLGGSTVNFRILFPKSKSEDTSSKKSGGDWIYVLHGIAKEGPFGDLEKTDKVGLFDILLYMEDMKRTMDKQKAKTKRK